MQYLFPGFFPIDDPADVMLVWNGKVQPELWPKIVEQNKVKTCCEIAEDYGVSYKAIGEY